MSTIEYSCGHQVSAHSGQAMPMQCACGEGEIVGARGQFYMSDEMSHSIRKAAMDASPLQAIKEEWDGSGAPPVGTECEVLDRVYGNFNRVEITAVSRDHLVAIFNGEEVLLKKNCQFRPIRTQAQRERDDLLTSIIEDYRKSLKNPVSTVEINLISEFANYLYDAGMLRRAGE